MNFRLNFSGDPDFANFVHGATDSQLRNIYERESDRAERYGNDTVTGREAADDAAAAREEMTRRGIFHES
jgi:hypothetical protein